MNKPKYRFYQIEDLKPLIINLVSLLKERINSNEYDLIIGDDTSGRIPTIVMKKIFDSRRGSKIPIKTIFISGTVMIIIPENKEILLRVLSKLKQIVRKKILIVTEYISTGKAVDRLGGLLNKIGIDFDIATLSSVREPNCLKSSFPDLIGHNIFIGKSNANCPPSIWGNTCMNGVENSIKAKLPFSPFSVPTKRIKRNGYEKSYYDQKIINSARKDAKILAKEVVRIIWP